MTDAASWSLLATPFSSSPWIGMDRVYVYTDCNNRITSLSLWIWEESLSSLSSLSSWSLLSTDNIQRSSKPVGSFFRTTLIITVAPETVPCTRRCRLSLSSARQHCSLCEWCGHSGIQNPILIAAVSAQVSKSHQFARCSKQQGFVRYWLLSAWAHCKGKEGKNSFLIHLLRCIFFQAVRTTCLFRRMTHCSGLSSIPIFMCSASSCPTAFLALSSTHFENGLDKRGTESCCGRTSSHPRPDSFEIATSCLYPSFVVVATCTGEARQSTQLGTWT